MKFIDIKFISPVNIGEEFSFAQLIENSINQKRLDDFLSQTIEQKLNFELIIKENNLKKDNEIILNKLKLEISKELLNEKKNFEKEKELIKKELEQHSKIIFEKEIIQLKEEKNYFSKLLSDKENLIKENKFLLENLTKTLKEQFDLQLQKETQRFNEEISNAKAEAIKSKVSTQVIGDSAETTIRKILNELFPNDKIMKPSEQDGEADIIQEIIDRDEKVGSIYYEIKNKNQWNTKDYENFAAKVRNRDHSIKIYIGKILMTNMKFQHIYKIQEDFFYDELNNIYITNFNSYLSVVFSLRNLFVWFKLKNKEETKEMNLQNELISFIKSQKFQNYFIRIKTNLINIEKFFNSIKNEANKGLIEVVKINDELVSLDNEILYKNLKNNI